MKYTIEGFSQAVLVEKGLDATDAILLRWFVDFQNTGKMRQLSQGSKTYHWVQYQAVIDDLPCLGISNKESLARRFQKLVRAEVLSLVIHSVGGRFSYFAIEPKGFLPLVDTLSTQKSIALDSKVDTLSTQKSNQIDSSTSNSSTKTQKDSIADSAIAYLNQKTGSKFRTHKGTGLSTIIKNGADLERIKAVIDLKVKEWSGSEFAQYLTPSTLFRVSNFEKYENQLRLPKNAKPVKTNKLQFGFDTFDPSREVPDEIPM